MRQHCLKNSNTIKLSSIYIFCLLFDDRLGDYIKTKHLKSLSNNKKDEENIFEDNKS